MFEDLTNPLKTNGTKKPFPHYYGDRVRILMIVIGVLMLGSMLVDTELLGLNILFGIIAVLFLAFVAGFMSPISRHAMIVATTALGILFLLFENFAIGAYAVHHNPVDLVFLFRQAISILSLVGFYFGIKSIRGMGQEL